MKPVVPVVCLMATLLASGCVSYSEMQARPASVVRESARPVDEVLGCMAPLWADFARVTVVPDGPGKVLNAIGAGPEQVLMQASVWPTPMGSMVEYRQAGRISTGTFRRARESVDACI